MIMYNLLRSKIVPLLVVSSLFSCNKLLEIPEPKNTLTTEKVFNNDRQAQGAVGGIMSEMMTGTTFASSLLNRLGAASADETNIILSSTFISEYYRNALTNLSSESDLIWNSAYKTIYSANALR